MKEKDIKNFLCLLFQLVVGCVFLYAGAVKLWGSGTEVFARDVARYDMLPAAWVSHVAQILPWLEIGIGSLLLIQLAVSGALLLATACSLVFLIAVGSAWMRGLNLSCGCFGGEDVAMNYPVKMAQLVGQLMLCFYLWNRHRLRVDP